MPADLVAALCLVLVFEGLVLLAAPGAWKRMAEQMQQFDERRLRVIGAVLVGCGLLALKIAR